MRALNNMIPECVHEYGIEAAKKWFTNIGLQAYQQGKWDPSKRSTTSQQDRETHALVKEDLFGIGTNWKIEAPIMKTKSARPTQPSMHSNHSSMDNPIHQALASRAQANDI
jgi:CCR4-NOT transcriptional regulation complex NOT5 subunit